MKATGTSLSGKTFYYSGENAREIAAMILPTVGDYTYSLDGTCDRLTDNPCEVSWCLNYNRNEGAKKSRGRYNQRCFSLTRNGKYPFAHLVR
jgi:hypothetical protein